MIAVSPITRLPNLNEDQAAAAAALASIAEAAGHLSLIGPAGTGKTTTITAAASRILDANRGSKILFLAPTHRARRCLMERPIRGRASYMTIHSFCGVIPDVFRDEDVFKLGDQDFYKRAKWLEAEEVILVVVDESSMVDPVLANAACDVCLIAGVGIVFTGDPYQLPPVKRKARDKAIDLDDDEDGPDVEELHEGMAWQFIAAPTTATLSRVMRHQGPILRYATAIRDNFDELATFPPAAASDESEIRRIYDPAGAFIQQFADLHRDYIGMVNPSPADTTEFYKAAPRTLCYTNGSCRNLTAQLRGHVYGPAARSRWVEGEIISFPHYTLAADAATGADTAIHSSTDAIVMASEVEDVTVPLRSFPWKTPDRKLARTAEVFLAGKFQKLTVQPLAPNGNPDRYGERIVFCPLNDDVDQRAHYRAMAEQLKRAKFAHDGDEWRYLKGIKGAYFTEVRSAYVMTIHKSQGSTFRHVYVHSDVLMKKTAKERNPLLYVAATRASHSLTFAASLAP